MNYAVVVVTVLGSSCSIPRPGRACSSYLIEDGASALLVDCGTGAFANLREYRAPEDLDAIVITHMHTDHFLDLIPMRYALRYGGRTRAGLIPLYLPPGGMAMLERLGETLSRESGDFFHDVYEMREYDPQCTLALGAATLRFAPTTHYIEAYAVRYDAHGRSITYSADTAHDDRVAQLAHGAQLFICEATLGCDGTESGARGHASARDAGKMAHAAGVSRLLLTHYGAECDIDHLRRCACEAYMGQVDVADDHLRIEVQTTVNVSR